MARQLPPARALRLGRAAPGAAARELSLWLAWSLRLGELGAQVAWFVVAAGCFGCWFVIPKVELHPPHFTRSTLGEIDGILRDHGITYSYLDERGVARTGTGKDYSLPSVGGGVRIYFDPERPWRSTTSDLPFDYGPGSLALLALPLGALLVAVLFMRANRRVLLLRYGELVEGVPVFQSGSDPRLARVRFVFHIAGTDAETDVTTPPRRRRSRDEVVPEPLLYDPANPDHAVALADLPGKPRLQGRRFAMTAVPLAPFVIPGAALASAVALIVRCL